MTRIVKNLQELQKLLVPPAVFAHYEKGTYQFPSLFQIEDGNFLRHQQLSTKGKMHSYEQLADWGFDTSEIDQFYKKYPEYLL